MVFGKKLKIMFFDNLIKLKKLVKIKKNKLDWEKLEINIKSISSIYQTFSIKTIYKNLLDNKVIKKLDIDILNKFKIFLIK